MRRKLKKLYRFGWWGKKRNKEPEGIYVHNLDMFQFEKSPLVLEAVRRFKENRLLSI